MSGAVDWKRGLAKVLLPTAVAVGIAVRNVGPLLGTVRFWGMLALIVAPEIAAGVASNYLRQSGRQALATLLAGAGIAWLVGGVALLTRHNDAVALTDAERAAFVTVEEGGQRRLRHPALGFSFLDPGPGFEATSSRAFRADAQFYSFADRERGIGLTIGLFKGQGDSPTSLRTLLESMSGQASALGGPGKVSTQIVELETPPDDPPRGDLHVVLGDGRHYRLQGYGWRSPDGTPFAILIAAMAHAPNAAADVLSSFRP